MSGYNLPGMGTFLACMGIAAVLGWGVIEFVLYLFSFVHLSLG